MISITDYDYDLDCGWSDKQNRKVGYICSVNKLVVFLASSSGGEKHHVTKTGISYFENQHLKTWLFNKV